MPMMSIGALTTVCQLACMVDEQQLVGSTPEASSVLVGAATIGALYLPTQMFGSNT